MHLNQYTISTSTHSCKYYGKHRAANLSFSYEYFYLHLHSQWWFEATFNSLLFSTFRRTEHSITEKKITERNLHVSNLLLVRLAATLHIEHNECHRVLASTQSSLQMKALVNLKIYHRSGEVIVSNRGKIFFSSFPSRTVNLGTWKKAGCKQLFYHFKYIIHSPTYSEGFIVN